MYNDYGADRYAPLGLNLQQDMNSVVKVYARMYNFPMFRDPGTVWNVYKMNNYIPLNYVIDTAGIVLYSMEGFNESVIRAYIESSLPPTGVSEGKTRDALRIVSAVPNPANRPTTISFSLSHSENVTLRVYSSSGKLVRTLLDGQATTGLNTVQWNLRNDAGTQVANGMYFYELTDGANSVRAKVSVLR
jgi:hypothetical protein